MTGDRVHSRREQHWNVRVYESKSSDLNIFKMPWPHRLNKSDFNIVLEALGHATRQGKISPVNVKGQSPTHYWQTMIVYPAN